MTRSIRAPQRGLTRVGLMAFLVVTSPWSPAPTRAGEGAQPVSAAARPRTQGAGSCSAVACHGSPGPRPGLSILGNEHTTWVSTDPHAGAYGALFSAASEKIVTRLAGKSGQHRPAYEDARCLTCHATPRTAAELRETAWADQDGVGCESCHGASERWLGPHTSGWWKTLPAAVKERDFGLVDTRDLARRADACARCHVGRREPTDAAPADVNHDLIAAGHPRLTFEFSAYHDKLPAHWVEKGRNAAPDFPARLWSVGRAASARTAASLLRDRATDPKAPWPEFAESDCFACHHNLKELTWRRGPRDPDLVPGSAAWGTWYFAPTLAPNPTSGTPRPIEDADELTRAVVEVVRSMARPVPDRHDVATRAGDLVRVTDRAVAARSAESFDARSVEALVSQVNARARWESPRGWDDAAQRYLALVPLRQTLGLLDPSRSQGPSQLTRSLSLLRDQLMFRPRWDSPAGYDPAFLVVPAAPDTNARTSAAD